MWAVLAAGGAVLAAFTFPVVAPLALVVVGFSAAGPVAGSIAAGIQACIGNVAAGSLFAVCQSVAMGGAIPWLWTATATAFGTVVGGAIPWLWTAPATAFSTVVGGAIPWLWTAPAAASGTAVGGAIPWLWTATATAFSTAVGGAISWLWTAPATAFKIAVGVLLA
ncbi:hypothetical protein WOLCODRAFT_64885 [Wolfiporia cocos MD-104 SS10]|uniref:Uncharacterized protein n=1 Tax=Wolfiporia cocos (strain MD-104) TaxID=742152 RepID=A0A2H3J9J3_WOLCO|nr:hypothetical protein WOLCODRAFT_64885 [Wolfiporia cocos MD-104 SS10]